jgi:hypothetical protein
VPLAVFFDLEPGFIGAACAIGFYVSLDVLKRSLKTRIWLESKFINHDLNLNFSVMLNDIKGIFTFFCCLSYRLRNVATVILFPPVLLLVDYSTQFSNPDSRGPEQFRY